jgi:hypothetical protein
MKTKEIIFGGGSLIVGALIVVALVIGGVKNETSELLNGPSVGSVSSPDIASPYLSFGDVRRWASHTGSLTQATTTICALQSPAATSTLVLGTLRLDVSSSTASTITYAKAATPYATTTLFNSVAVAANGQAAILAASTTVSALTQTNAIFAPNQYLVVGMQGGVGTFSPTGSCNAVWQEL